MTGLLWVVFVVLFTLKLVGAIALSWWLVFLPIILHIGFCFIFGALFFIGAYVGQGVLR